MRIFAASIGTETNTFAPIPTRGGGAGGGAKAEGWTLVEGSCAWAEPAGLVARSAYESLRDEVLGQLQAAMPVDGVLLGLHGAMVASARPSG